MEGSSATSVGHDIDHGADHDYPTAQGEVHLSPVSPVTITMFVTAFGGVGLIATRTLALPVLLSLPMAFRALLRPWPSSPSPSSSKLPRAVVSRASASWSALKPR